jgi:uridine kinase
MQRKTLAHADVWSLIRKAQGTRPRVLVGIDGPGGSGKSTLGSVLARSCASAALVHGDDFFFPSALRRTRGAAQRPGWEFDLERLRDEVLHPFCGGNRVRYHRYDWDTDTIVSEADEVDADTLIIEGIYTTSSVTRRLFDFRIWVDCPREERLRRGLERDGAAARNRWVNDWMPQEDEYVKLENPRRHANLVVYCGALSGVDRQQAVVISDKETSI